MAPSLNLTGGEKRMTIFIPVISDSVSLRLVHAMATNGFEIQERRSPLVAQTSFLENTRSSLIPSEYFD